MAYCPKCRAEYVDGVDRCADCDEPLVGSLPPEEDLVPIYNCTDVLEANLVKETLEAEGIEGNVLSQEDRMFPADGLGRGYHVLVVESQAERARTVVKEGLEQQLFGASGELVD